MSEIATIVGFIIWLFIIYLYRRKFNVLPTANTVLILITVCMGIPFGVLVCLAGFINYLNINIEDHRWIAGIGGIALFWISFDQLRKELTGEPNNKSDFSEKL
ncbi:MAG: hypothetical protein GY839_21435 [candidate division Zixibacteria bacterium]|nr:hypothetical protein [candidate division Zixibacteria bacterium]